MFIDYLVRHITSNLKALLNPETKPIRSNTLSPKQRLKQVQAKVEAQDRQINRMQKALIGKDRKLKRISLQLKEVIREVSELRKQWDKVSVESSGGSRRAVRQKRRQEEERKPATKLAGSGSSAKNVRKLTVLLAAFNRKEISALTIDHRKQLFFGQKHYCLLCESQLSSFLVFGNVVPRPSAWCPVCGSLERHRLIWMFLQQQTDLLESHPKTLLHVAPEGILETKFRQYAHIDYISADLNNPQAMVKMDITDIQYPENSFDVILCSHVLEHVPDDRQAMREFNRVLKPDGFAILMVPITAERTFEDSSVTSPEERERMFGQYDHVRKYGLDFEDRAKESGLSVKVFSPTGFADPDDFLRLGLGNPNHGLVFFCEKRES